MEDRATIAKNLNAMAPEGSSTDLNIPRSFIAVYDGHSSARGSEHAARRLHHFIAAQSDVWACKGRGDQSEASAMETSLKKAFENVDQEIIATAERHNKRYGTTAVCALVIGSELFVAHAGDSRAVLYRDGAAVQLTRDHKPASVPEERKRIEAQGKMLGSFRICGCRPPFVQHNPAASAEIVLGLQAGKFSMSML